MIDKQKLITWMELNGYDFYKGSYDKWLADFRRFVNSRDDREPPEKCKFILMPEPSMNYKTECGNHIDEEFLLVRNKYIFCPYCGKEIEVS